jgi:RND family efflux transporter MFP subunit
VAERYIDEGDTVSVNQRLLRIVDLDPLIALVNVTESDYPSIRPGDAVSVQADAFPGRTFAGEVIRIAPVFSELSRQAAVEFHVPNEDRLLRPGMFVRASLVLQEREGVTLIPQAALVRRGNRDGVFLIKPGAETVAWQPVETGIAEAERIEVRSPGLEGRVVTLGQQLLEDGTRVQVREEAIPAP